MDGTLMKIPLYQVDAFADRVFTGNPAAVCPLPAWLDDTLLQAIAEENNLSETAFTVAEADVYRLRWFTPAAEVDLCGHATLAAAHVLFEHVGVTGDELRFATRSGELRVRRRGDVLHMDLPAAQPEPVDEGLDWCSILGVEPVATLAAYDDVIVLDSEQAVRRLQPDMTAMAALSRRGVVVTAPGETVDFVARCFFPRLAVPEDPVTGSAFCEMAPYWAARLGRRALVGLQCSRRGGTVRVLVDAQRVTLIGTVRDYLAGCISLGD
jgi:PhzF family phenazine biosynthesis protein